MRHRMLQQIHRVGFEDLGNLRRALEGLGLRDRLRRCGDLMGFRTIVREINAATYFLSDPGGEARLTACLAAT